MRICLVSREYPSDDHAGGIGTYTEKTARTLAGLGHTVDVITESASPSRTVEDGVTVHRLAPARLAGPIPLPNTRSVARSRAVAEAVARLPHVPDVVQVCENGAEGFWYALRTHPSTSLVTRLATPTCLVAELSPHAGGGALKVRWLDWLERVQTRRSHALISPSAALADLVSARWDVPRGRITVMRTGVDFARRYASRAEELPAELRGQDFILYFGRLEERKGLHVLAQALPAVLAAHPRLRCVFVGNNFMTYRGEPMQAYIERCNAAHLERILFYPRLRQTALYSLLDHALLMVSPSLWESVPNAALEALDMGKPVVATLGCGFGEVIEDGRSGVLVPPGDVDGLRDALVRLLADRPRLARMSDAARARARAFSMETVVGDLLDFYRDLRRSAAAA
jgi:glycosyltransferase involved in cell wall biosynthesis